MKPRPAILFALAAQEEQSQLRKGLSEAPFNIIIAASEEEAFDLLASNRVDMIVCDSVLADGSDGRILDWVQNQYPSTIRTLLLKEHDDQTAVWAISLGLASSTFSRPLDPTQIQQDCQQMMKMREILNNPAMDSILNSIGSLPSLPEVYFQFLQAMKQGKTNRELAEIVNRDAALATNILHITNSAFFSSYKITSIERAIVQLGQKKIKDTLLTLSLVFNFPWTSEQKNEINQIITHANLVSKLTAQYHQTLHIKQQNESISSDALTHDIGKILLLYYFPDIFFRVRELMNSEQGLSFREGELRLTQHGIGHCELGAYFLSVWNLPASNCNAALYHHSPQAVFGSQAHLIHLISLANLRANLPVDISGEEWLSETQDMPFTQAERLQLWKHEILPLLDEAAAIY